MKAGRELDALGVVMVLALVACTDILAPSGKQLVPEDGWLYEVECIEWVPREHIEAFKAQVPSWYFERCDPYHIISYAWVNGDRRELDSFEVRR